MLFARALFVTLALGILKRVALKQLLRLGRTGLWIVTRARLGISKSTVGRWLSQIGLTVTEPGCQY